MKISNILFKTHFLILFLGCSLLSCEKKPNIRNGTLTVTFVSSSAIGKKANIYMTVNDKQILIETDMVVGQSAYSDMVKTGDTFKFSLSSNTKIGSNVLFKVSFFDENIEEYKTYMTSVGIDNAPHYIQK